MKVASALLAATLSLAALATPAAADRWHYLIEQRLSEHARLIEEGRRDGSITRSEARQLNAQQRIIMTDVARFKRDGLSNRERDAVRLFQDKAAEDIFRLRNNDVRAPRYFSWLR